MFEGFRCCLELVRRTPELPEASISPEGAAPRFITIFIQGLFSFEGCIPAEGWFFLPASHFRPVKSQHPNIAGSKEGKILPCLTFCRRHGQISEVNHHEWSHLRVRPATPLCGWITRRSESPAEETAGDFLSALSPFMTCLTVPAPFTGMSCFAKRNR